MLNYITATNLIDYKDMLINLDHIIRIVPDESNHTLFTDRTGTTFAVYEPIENIAATIRIIQAAQLSQQDRKE